MGTQGQTCKGGGVELAHNGVRVICQKFMKDAATCRYRESTPIVIYTTCESSFNNDHQRGSSEHLPEEIQPSPKRQCCCCDLNVMCKIRCIHSNGSNHDKKSGSSSIQVNSFVILPEVQV